MVEVQRAIEVAPPPAPAVVVAKVEVVGKRFHRITLEWAGRGNSLPQRHYGRVLA